jgi:hypothetical protein
LFENELFAIEYYSYNILGSISIETIAIFLPSVHRRFAMYS